MAAGEYGALPAPVERPVIEQILREKEVTAAGERMQAHGGRRHQQHAERCVAKISNRRLAQWRAFGRSAIDVWREDDLSSRRVEDREEDAGRVAVGHVIFQGCVADLERLAIGKFIGV